MTAEQQRELVALVKGVKAGGADAAQAGDRLVRHQLPLVKWVLGKLGLMTTREHIQAGQIGLLEAARRWDASRSKWSSYAYFWIRKFAYLERKHDVGRDVPVDDTTLPLAVGDMRDDLDIMAAMVADEGRRQLLYRALARLPDDVQLAARCRFRLYDNVEPNPEPHDRAQEREALKLMRKVIR